MVLQSLQRRKARPVPSEHYEQASFMQRLAWLMPQLVDFVAAVPNGGKRDKRTAARMKREGQRKSFPDIVTLLARGGYFGLLIEFKRQGVTRAEDGQHALHALYRAQGYRVEVCAGVDVAWRIFTEYVTSESTQVERPQRAMAGDASGAFDV